MVIDASGAAVMAQPLEDAVVVRLMASGSILRAESDTTDARVKLGVIYVY